MLGQLSAAFLAGDPRAEPFLPSAFKSPEARRQSVLAASGRAVHPELTSALAAFEAALPASPERRRNLVALSRPGTVAVVTGQQVGLFLGPLYAVYKAASAVVAA